MNISPPADQENFLECITYLNWSIFKQNQYESLKAKIHSKMSLRRTARWKSYRNRNTFDTTNNIAGKYISQSILLVNIYLIWVVYEVQAKLMYAKVRISFLAVSSSSHHSQRELLLAPRNPFLMSKTYEVETIIQQTKIAVTKI